MFGWCLPFLTTNQIWYDCNQSLPDRLTKINGIRLFDNNLLSSIIRSGGGVVDNTLDYQSRGRKIDPPLLRSFG